MSTGKIGVIAALPFTVLTLLVFAYFAVLMHARSIPVNAGAEPLVVSIPSGASFRRISTEMSRQTDLADPRWFRMVFYSTDYPANALRAGEFEVPSNTSLGGLIELLMSSPPYQHRFTVPEGISYLDLRYALQSNQVLVDSVLPETQSALGYLPETYFFERGITRGQLLRRMETSFIDTVEEIWQSRSRDLAISSIEELVILASIIEKETGVTSERDLVSAVFHNRLRAGMRLQSDPTVIYAVAGDAGLDRPISKADLAYQHPYNTYRVKGLPPGPICLPGKDALFAAAHPAAVAYRYFVADGIGGHRFAEDLKGHNQNVALYRAYQKQQKEN